MNQLFNHWFQSQPQFSVRLLLFFICWVAPNSKPLASNTFRYLEADVRRNGRNEAGEGGHPPMVPRGGFATKPAWRLQERLSREFCATKLWPKFRVDPPNSRDREPRSTRGNHFAHSFLLRFSPPSSCLNSAFRIDKNPQTHPMKHLRLPIRDQERGWISYLTIDSNPHAFWGFVMPSSWSMNDVLEYTKPLLARTSVLDKRRNFKIDWFWLGAVRSSNWVIDLFINTSWSTKDSCWLLWLESTVC